MHDDRVILIAVFQHIDFPLEFLVLQLKTLNIKLSLALTRRPQKDKASKLFPGAILIRRQDFYPELAQLHTLQQIASVTFQIASVSKERLSYPFAITARALRIWIGVVDKANSAGCIWRRGAIRFSLSLSG
ncbi:Uncharacterised protein [Klebsiella variicola]|uniref:hypothetical protein n=1 Tax=Klebsiella pneumoniae complex TaxID=3390273 RepID=UPI000E2DF448|nr:MULTISPECIES: hypothetical protein [Klebsiella]UPS71429.1 hypothetical protein M0M92_19080 [Klebsiella quasipneumoniae]SXF14980.1 Uncharacterised protein [Klebsiella variicola]